MTNPTKQEYISWAKENLKQKSNNTIEIGLISLFGNYFLEDSTTSNNYIFISVYTTKLDKNDSNTVIGVLHNFIPIN